MGRVGGREMQEGREMGTYCICIADSLCYRADANALLWGNYTSIKMFEKKKKESACQCRGHGFKPWSGKIPHSTKQLSPYATTSEPAL